MDFGSQNDFKYVSVIAPFVPSPNNKRETVSNFFLATLWCKALRKTLQKLGLRFSFREIFYESLMNNGFKISFLDQNLTEVYSEPCQTFKMERFVKTDLRFWNLDFGSLKKCFMELLNKVALLKGIIQTLRNAVFGKNLPLPLPLVTVRNVSNMSPPSVA